MQTYEILRIGFYTCLAAAILFFVIALLLFFLFDVRSIIAARTGRTKAQSIQEMEAATSSTGRLIHQKHNTNTTGKLKDGKVKITKGTITPPTGSLSGAAITENIAGADETAALSSDNTQTAVLGEDDSQTAVLGANSAETAVLGMNGAETSVLGQDSPTQRFGEAETSVLVSAESIAPVEGVRFEIVKKVILCGTEETIAN